MDVSSVKQAFCKWKPNSLESKRVMEVQEVKKHWFSLQSLEFKGCCKVEANSEWKTALIEHDKDMIALHTKFIFKEI